MALPASLLIKNVASNFPYKLVSWLAPAPEDLFRLIEVDAVLRS